MEDIANIALICFLMGVGISTFLAIIAVYLVAYEFMEGWYFGGNDD